MSKFDWDSMDGWTSGLSAVDEDTYRKKVIEEEDLVRANKPAVAAKDDLTSLEQRLEKKLDSIKGVEKKIDRLLSLVYDNENIVEFYPGVGDFAWVVPESKQIARIGLIARQKAGMLFKDFITDRIGKNYKTKIIELQGGLSPVYNPKVQTQKDNVYLVGDAASMVKATTAGGIVQGLIGAEALVNSIENLAYM